MFDHFVDARHYRINQWIIPGLEEAPIFPCTSFDNPDTSVDTDTVVVFEAATSLAVSPCWYKVTYIVIESLHKTVLVYDGTSASIILTYCKVIFLSFSWLALDHVWNGMNDEA